MRTSETPRSSPGTGSRGRAQPEPVPGPPSRALRMRAARGWVRFMRRAEAETEQQRETGT
ncbi:hypothetical protein ACWC1D_17475 [Streptomyces sp. NPDC001478]